MPHSCITLNINKEWLDKLGLEVPTTIDEMEEVMIAFRDGDPNGNGIQDEIAFDWPPAHYHDVYALTGAYGVVDSLSDSMVVIQDGKISFLYENEAFYKLTQRVHKWYEEGLMADSFCQQENRANDANASSPVYRSLPYIEKHFCEEQLSLATVAEQVGLSASRFSTLFHEQMNCNFKEYVDALRLEKAKRLLKESDLLIAEIARQVGYENSYSFSRLFKRLAGVTPQAYRQSCQDGSRAES